MMAVMPTTVVTAKLGCVAASDCPWYTEVNVELHEGERKSDQKIAYAAFNLFASNEELKGVTAIIIAHIKEVHGIVFLESDGS